MMRVPRWAAGLAAGLNALAAVGCLLLLAVAGNRVAAAFAVGSALLFAAAGCGFAMMGRRAATDPARRGSGSSGQVRRRERSARRAS